jgi:predicted phage tail protein
MSFSCFSLCPYFITIFCLLAMVLLIKVSDSYAAEVTLAWNPNPESSVRGYKIYYGTSSRTYQQSIDVGNVTTYRVQSLADGVTYYFAATAYDSARNESGYSNEVSHTTPLACITPAVPSSITYPTSNNTGAFTVSWTAVSGATSYVLERSASSSFSSTAQVYSGSATSFNQTGLASGTYYYRIRAVNSCSGSGWRTGPAVTVTTCTAPAVPGSITYPTSNSTGAFTVSWTAVSGATSYVLERSTSSTFGSPAQVYSGSATTFNQSGLGSGTYYYRVRAVNSCGNSSWRNGTAVTVAVATCTTPAAPGSITYPQTNSSGSFTVSWTAVSGATSYVLQRSTSSTFGSPTQVYSGSATTFNQSGLASGTYYYRVRAVNSCGNSTWRNGTAVAVTICTTPAAPGSIAYPSSSDSGAFTVSWTAVSGATSYVLQRSTSSTFGSPTQVYSGSATTFNQSGLASGTYYYRVRAVNSCGNSTWRNGTAVAVTICTTPAAPGSITYPQTNSSGAFTVSWPAVSGATSYVLQRSTSSTFDTRTQAYSGSATSFNQTGLAPGTYYYRVRAVNSCGRSLWRTGTAVNVSSCTAPSSPSSITYPSSSSSGVFTVTWTGVSGATSYVLQRSTSSSFSSAMTVYSGTSTSFSQTGLPPGSYYYRVKAVSTCGESGWRTGTPLTRSSLSVKGITFDVQAISFKPENGTPTHPTVSHDFTEGEYTESFNGGVNSWEDAPGTSSIGLVGDAWRMVVSDPGMTSTSRISGHGPFQIPPTNFEISARLSSFAPPAEGSPYTVSVGTSSETDTSLLCKANATLIADPLATGQTIDLNGWVGTMDLASNHVMRATPLRIEGFDVQTETLGLRITVSDAGKRCTAQYQRNDGPWVQIGTRQVPPADGVLYGWYAEGTTDVRPAVEASMAAETPQGGDAPSGGGGGGGCDLNPNASFGLEWMAVLLLLMLLRFRRTE